MSEFRHIGKVRRRQDGRAIVTGKALYCDDLPIKNCKYAKVLHSPYPHAEIVSIDTSEAEKLPGVIGVMTYKNAPDWKTGVPAHRPVMSQHLRFVGDPVAAVAAETPQIAEEALELIKVEYKELTPVYDVEDAINDVFLRLTGVVPLLRSMDCCTLRAYLVSTIRNASYNLAQRRLSKERHSVYDSEGLILSAQPARDNTEDEILRVEQIETLKQALSRLSDREFTVLSMRYFEEAGDLEIARALDISPKSVRTYLTRARRRLNEIMKEITGDGKQSNE